MLGLIPWLLLVGAVVLFKENRRGQVLWILLPVVIVRLLLVQVRGLSPSEASMFISMIDCLLIGFVLNWLLAERIGNRNRFVTWILALLIFVVVLGVNLVNLGLGTEALQISILIGLIVGILLE